MIPRVKAGRWRVLLLRESCQSHPRPLPFHLRSKSIATNTGAARHAADRRVEAEHFIEQVGFAACLTDARPPGPSLYVAVCGRRDAVMPRNVQKDPEASLTWS